MRKRGSAILLENNKVVLIKRNRDGQIYYVFPGGGIEKGETPDLAAKREAFEELGVNINVNECFGKVEYNGTQYFFLADIVEGEIGTGMGEEFTDTNRNRGTYEPMWVEIDKLSIIDIRPKEVAEKIQFLLS
ncbi:mutator mutT protein [Gracilibacillus orientalis]|uniref:Mutator mutT protein n=1 Tax=Gracilibacillus orientalis TaxID=334253 RepID=A0A1I4R5P2_9BACI|nr:NUDIX domain-containing protein [Gracilibacillus orientalis]SFM47587.1 mutator mutT protein [Gracilibacillus orientalis]